jgi:hypothetical protein
MVNDDDVEIAELAILELPRARTAPFNASLNIIRHLVNVTKNNGMRSLDLENARADAWLAICALGQTLEKERRCSDELWDKAIKHTEHWKSLLA